MHPCHSCGLIGFSVVEPVVYLRASSTNSSELFFCSDSCWNQFDTQLCYYCDRHIMDTSDFVQDEMCVSCYRTFLNQGQPESNFYSKCIRLLLTDFVVAEFEKKGYVRYETFSTKDNAVKARARQLIHQGAHVIARYVEQAEGPWNAAELWVNIRHLKCRTSVTLFALRGRSFGGNIVCGRDICALIGKSVLATSSDTWIDLLCVNKIPK